MTSRNASSDTLSRAALDSQVDAVMDAVRVLIAVVAQSIAETEAQVTLPQLRVLVMVNRHGPLNLNSVANGLGVHPSNATRTCQKLVQAKLLDRHEDPVDRRNVVLTLTPAGIGLVESVMEHRRDAIGHVVQQMPAARRDHLARALRDFAAAAGETPEEQAHTLGWAP